MKKFAAATARRFVRHSDGTAAIEYGLAAALISAGIVSFLSDIDDTSGLLGRIKQLMDSILT